MKAREFKTVAYLLDGSFRPLRHDLFRALWTMNVFSNIGTWMQNAAAGWVMAGLTPSPLWVGLIQTAATLPIFLFAIPGGILADRHNRRQVLLVTQIALALFAFSFALFTWAGIMTPGWLLALTFLLGSGTALNTPAWHGTVSNLVEPDEVTSAVSLHNLSLNIGRAVGPALAGLVLSRLGAGTAFALNALSFVGVIAVLWRWDAPPPPPRGGWRETLSESFQLVRRRTALRWLLIQAGIFFALAIPLWSFLPVIARDLLHAGAGGYGLLMACLGTGAAAAAALFTACLRRWRPGELLARSVMVYAFAEAGAVLARSFVGTCVWLLVAGGAWFVVSSLMIAGSQVPFPPRLRSRATAFILVILYGGQAIGSAASGLLAPRFGVTAAVIGAALLMAVGAALRLFSHLDLRSSL